MESQRETHGRACHLGQRGVTARCSRVGNLQVLCWASHGGCTAGFCEAPDRLRLPQRGYPGGRLDLLGPRTDSLRNRVVRKMQVIFSKMEIQNAKKYPKIFSKNAKYHPKCRKNSFRCQYGHHILDWEVGIL